MATGTDWYVKLPGIDGDVITTGFEKQIGVTNFSIGVISNPSITSSGEVTPPKPIFTPIHLGLVGGSANGAVFGVIVEGKYFDTVTISGTKLVNKITSAFVTFTLKKVYVTNVSYTMGADGELTIGGLSIVFGEIGFQYKSQKAGILTTTTEVTYDVQKQQIVGAK